MKRALCRRSPCLLRGVSSSSSISTVGWARNQGSVRKSTGLLPQRAEFIQEPEWKIYEQGDPKLYDNWKGKAPNPIPENADIDPNDFSMCVDQYPQYGPTSGLVLQLLTAFGFIGVVWLAAAWYAPIKERNKDAIKGDWRTMPLEQIEYYVEQKGASLPQEWHEGLKRRRALDG